MPPKKREKPAAEFRAVAPSAKRERKTREVDDGALHPSLAKSVTMKNGRVWVWGEGDCGQLGTGPDLMGRYRPHPLGEGSALAGKDIVQVECGGMHSCCLTSNGDVYTWGVNDECALGRVTDDDGSTEPRIVKGINLASKGDRVIQLVAGDSHTLALTMLGEVWGWGTYRDESGPMGFPCCARGSNPKFTKMAATPVRMIDAPGVGGDRILKLASGTDHTLALTRSGKVLSWGCGLQGQLGRVGARVSDRARLATFLTPTAVKLPGRGVKVAEIYAGFYASFFVTSEDQVLACGLNNYGQLGVPRSEPVYAPMPVKPLCGKGVAGMGAGQHHTLALSGGTVLSFGSTPYGRLGRAVPQVKDATSETPAAPGPIPPAAFEGGPVKVAAGIGISGAICNGRVYTWGCNVSYQNAKGEDDDDEMVPKKLAETKKFNGQQALQLEFGGQHALLLASPLKI